MAVSKRLRFEILRRDGFRCRYCGLTASVTELRVDHVVPEALGGSDDPTNLATACDPCNTGKSSVLLGGQTVADIAVAIETDNASHEADDDFVFVLLNALDGAITEHFKRSDGAYDIGCDYKQTLITFRHRGLTFDDIVHAADVTRARGLRARELCGDGQRWRNFCAVCWRMIRDRQSVLPDRTLV